MTPEEKAKTAVLACGPECTCDMPKTGLSLGRLDDLGAIYPDATHALYDSFNDEWVVYEFDEHAATFMRKVATHPGKEVQVIRNMAIESKLYSHTFRIVDD